MALVVRRRRWKIDVVLSLFLSLWLLGRRYLFRGQRTEIIDNNSATRQKQCHAFVVLNALKLDEGTQLL